MSRAALEAFIEERKGEPILEIGPLISPLVDRDIHNAFFADIRSTEEIYEFYLPLDVCPDGELRNKLVPIDFVIRESYEKDVAGHKFNVIVSSHVIEHVHDLILHFHDLSKVLNEDGFLVMAIPDRRYTFDHFREVTPFRDMHDVYMRNDFACTARLAFDFEFNRHPCNYPVDYQNNAVSFYPVAEEDRFLEYQELYKQIKDEGLRYDAHFWVFTYITFLDFLRDCLRANLLPYTLHYSHPPLLNCGEFTIILKKDLSILEDSDKRMAEMMKIIDLSESQIVKDRDKAAEPYVEEALEEQLARLTSTTSWKVTRPLRALGRLLKK
ncbi:MAG: class I SAM-dependent methyltransferase [Coriobacteriia bacterium]|nr:class I SAM-dependent methyltransferase [Coriobacteriia bacterium]MCL2749765.1 class I SAM-dependent methyltransferase [Coriobacteriia bacterium]